MGFKLGTSRGNYADRGEIKTKLSFLGKSYRFSYPYKTDYNVLLEEEKLSN